MGTEEGRGARAWEGGGGRGRAVVAVWTNWQFSRKSVRCSKGSTKLGPSSTALGANSSDSGWGSAELARSGPESVQNGVASTESGRLLCGKISVNCLPPQAAERDLLQNDCGATECTATTRTRPLRTPRDDEAAAGGVDLLLQRRADALRFGGGLMQHDEDEDSQVPLPRLPLGVLQLGDGLSLVRLSRAHGRRSREDADLWGSAARIGPSVVNVFKSV